MDERRKLPRKYLMAYSAVFNYKSGEQLGLLCDMSIDGLMLICKQDFAPEQDVELRIDLPEVPPFKKTMLRVKARSIWSQPDIDPRLVNIGFQFINLAPEDRAIVAQMIEIYEFRRDKNPPPSIYQSKI